MYTYPIEGMQKKTLIVKKTSGSSGLIYLPGEWVGEEVEVVRTGRKILE